MNTVQSGTQTVRKKDTLEEELTIASVEKRNWRGIFIALLVIAGVLALIVFSIILLSPDFEHMKQYRRRPTLNEILNNHFFDKENGSFVSDTEVVYRDKNGCLLLFNIVTRAVKQLLNNTIFEQLEVDSYSLSPDQNYVLLCSKRIQKEMKYRKTSEREDTWTSICHVYEIFSQSFSMLSSKLSNEKSSFGVQKVMWAPLLVKESILNNISSDSTTSKMQNIEPITKHQQQQNNEYKSRQAIAFVYRNDVYFKYDVQEESTIRLSKTGSHGSIFNGVPDWMYSFDPNLKTETLEFSSCGKYLAFLTFNTTEVLSYRFIYDYNEAKNYPSLKLLKYPKPTTPNPTVTINIVDVSASMNQRMFVPHIPFQYSVEYYVGGLTWTRNSELSFICTDRNQTKSVTYLCKPPEFECIGVFEEEQLNNGFVFPSEKSIFIKKKVIDRKMSNNQFEESYILRRLPIRVGKDGTYRHLVATRLPNENRNQNKVKRYILTFGKFEVTQLVDFNERNDTIYYIATMENRPGYRQFFKMNIKFNLTSEDLLLRAENPVCLTCYSKNNIENISANTNLFYNEKFDNREAETVPKITNNTHSNNSFLLSVAKNSLDLSEPSYCLFNDVQLSHSYSYYLQECLGPNVPSTFIVDLQTNHKVFVWKNGFEKYSIFHDIAIPIIKKFSVLIKNGLEAQVKLYLPPQLDEDEDLAFPLILNIDATPGSQLVSEEFKIDWNWYLACSKSIIVAQVDARGSGFQGEHNINQVKRKLGFIEVEDQLSILTYLKDTFQFVDPSRIGVYGQGYGGYIALNALADDNVNLLKFAIAVSPIVSLKFYYSFFTERFLPMDETFNELLHASDLSTKVKHFDQKKFLLIHGTADEVVHQQHSHWLTKALIASGIIFRQQIYADEGYHLYGVQQHMYKTMESFIYESFEMFDDYDKKGNHLFGFRK